MPQYFCAFTTFHQEVMLNEVMNGSDLVVINSFVLDLWRRGSTVDPLLFSPVD